MTLAVEALQVRFDAIEALAGVSLVAAPGERLGLVGPNGAGKTTLLDTLSGLVRPRSGWAAWNGARLTGLPPDGVARAGVARTFQTPRLFTRMTVEANVRAGRALDPMPWLALTGLAGRRRDLAGSLTPGEARRLELARALAGGPRLLLLDEPCGGLSRAEAEAMAALVEATAAPARLTLLVEHRLGVVTRLCDRVIVLELGAKIFDGSPTAMRADPGVRQAYLGHGRTP